MHSMHCWSGYCQEQEKICPHVQHEQTEDSGTSSVSGSASLTLHYSDHIYSPVQLAPPFQQLILFQHQPPYAAETAEPREQMFRATVLQAKSGGEIKFVGLSLQ